MPHFISDEDMAKLEASTPDAGFISDEEMQKLESSGPSKMESFLRGASQGATFGFGDELSAGLEQAIGGVLSPELYEETPFAQSLKENRQINAEAQMVNPKSYMGGELAGGITTTAPIPLGSGGLLAKTGKAALQGATEGGISSLGYSEDKSLDDVLRGITTGGLISGGVTGGLGLVGKGAGMAKNILRKAETDSALRALGATKGLKKSLLKQGINLDEMTNQAIERDLIRASDALPFGADQVQRVDAFKKQAGERIGEILQESDIPVELQSLLNKVKPAARETIEGTLSETSMFPKTSLTEALEGTLSYLRRGTPSDVMALKNKVSEQANWKSPAPTDINQQHQEAWRLLNQAEGDAVSKLPDLGDYAQAKKDYKLASNLEKLAINKESAVANRRIGLTDIIVGSGGFAAGGIPGAVGGVAVKKGMEALGGAPMAIALNKARKFMEGPRGVTLQRYVDILSQAAQRGDDAVLSTDFLLQQQYPDYYEAKQELENLLNRE